MDSLRWLQGWRQRELLIALGIALASMLIWRIPTLGLISYPFRLFGTFIHEICHGLAALFTGGSFQRFAVNPDLSGVAFSAGGIRWIIVSAGYVGSAIFGALLMIVASRNISPNAALFWLGISLGLLCILFVRNFFGIGTGLLLSAALVYAGQRLPLEWASGLLLILAVQMILDAFNSLLDLLKITTSMRGTLTDAEIMARATGIPALLWALLWAAISAVILVWAVQTAYRK